MNIELHHQSVRTGRPEQRRRRRTPRAQARQSNDRVAHDAGVRGGRKGVSDAMAVKGVVQRFAVAGVPPAGTRRTSAGDIAWSLRAAIARSTSGGSATRALYRAGGADIKARTMMTSTHAPAAIAPSRARRLTTQKRVSHSWQRYGDLKLCDRISDE
jgi:hypothetical protein